MDVKELTNLLTTSATMANQRNFIPWWEDDFENCIYRYRIFPKNASNFMKVAQVLLNFVQNRILPIHFLTK